MPAQIDLTKNITIGQYVPTNSIIHRMDPRFKIAAYVIIIIAIVLTNGYIGNIIGLTFSLLLFYISKIPIRYGMSGLKPAIPFIIILGVMQLLFLGGIAEATTIYYQKGPITISDGSIQIVIVSCLRFIEIIFISSVLTLSTSTTDTTNAMQRLMKPLNYIKVPVHEFSLIITIAIRFVPTFAMEMEKMMKAQASRGAEFGTGERWRFIQKTKDMFPIILPLFNIALQRGEGLILAMEARCFTPGSSRTIYSTYKSEFKDYLLLLMAVLIFLVLLYLKLFFNY